MKIHPWCAWALAALVLVSYPAVNFMYWPLELNAGVLPRNADTIAIPMFNSIIFSLIVSPVVLGITWISTRQPNPETTLFAWRADRLVRSSITAIVCAAPAALNLYSVIDGRLRGIDWYQHLWEIFGVFLVLWLLVLRAFFVERLQVKPSDHQGGLPGSRNHIA